MPQCYLLCVSEGASLDLYSNQWSLFGLIDNFKVDGSAAPSLENPFPLPVEVHAHWLFEDHELGAEYEWRLVTSTDSGEFPHERTSATKAMNNRVRHREFGLN